MKKISTPLTNEIIRGLVAGDQVSLNGTIYTARDLAHQELIRALRHKKKLPFALNNQIIYYCGPTPAIAGRPIGSCGPTTSSRMDDFTPQLLKAGLRAMIGKGKRSPEVRRAIKKHGAVYFLAVGGAGAILATKVKQAKVIAYARFGPEAIHQLEVEDFPLIVGIDCCGRDLFTKA
ncbi:FumA C-terminus/TtdB family hydratase beta subunit [Candidatus Omnitrophota bacterium]